MSEPTMKKVNGDGIKIQLALWGNTGKPILCLHGITANCRSWDCLASTLSPHHRIMAMDLRGRGLSDKPPSGYSIDHHCGDILAVIDDLGLERVVLMGHSLGAFIALGFAAQYTQKVDRLILVDGGGKLSETQRAKVFVAIKPASDRLGKVFPSRYEYLRILKQAPYLQPWNSYLETYCQYEIEEVEGGVRANIDPKHFQEESINFGKWDPSQYYSQIQTPTLILRATKGLIAYDDILLPEDVVQEMVHKIPNSRYFDLSGTNHYSILFQPNAHRDRAILEFLKT